MGGGYNNSANLNAFSYAGGSREARDYKDSDYSYDMFGMIGGNAVSSALSPSKVANNNLGIDLYPQRSEAEIHDANIILSPSSKRTRSAYQKRYLSNLNKWRGGANPPQDINDRLRREAMKYSKMVK